MSGAVDRRDKKRLVRARDDLRRAFARSDADLVLASLRELGAEAAPADLVRGAALVRGAIVAAHSARQWSRLASLGCALARSGDSLLGHEDSAATEQDRRSMRWALLWGFSLSGDWTRARAAWENLEPDARARRPELAEALTAWLDGAGVLTGEPAARFVASAAVLVDPRLGYDPAATATAPRLDEDRPATSDDVVPAIARVLASSSIRDARRAVEGWLSDPRDPVVEIAARAAEAGLLSARRLRRVDREEAFELIASALARLDQAPRELLVAAIRLSLCALEEDGLGAGTTRVLQIALRDARTRPLLIRALSAPSELLPSQRLLALLALASDTAPDAGLWVRRCALIVRGAGKERGVRALEPEQVRDLERGLRRLLDELSRTVPEPGASGPNGTNSANGEVVKLGRALSDHGEGAQRQMMNMLACLLEPSLAARFCQWFWDVLSDRQRNAFADGLAARFDCTPAGYCDHCDEWHESEPRPLSREERALWSAVGARVAPHSLDLLAWWSKGQSPAVASEAVARFAEHASDIFAFLDALELAHLRAPRARARDTLVARMLERFAGDANALAYAVVEGRLERGARAQVEAAFVAVVRASVASPSAEAGLAPIVYQALERLDRAEKARVRRKRKRAVQVELALPEPVGAARPKRRGRAS